MATAVYGSTSFQVVAQANWSAALDAANASWPPTLLPAGVVASGSDLSAIYDGFSSLDAGKAPQTPAEAIANYAAQLYGQLTTDIESGALNAFAGPWPAPDPGDILSDLYAVYQGATSTPPPGVAYDPTSDLTELKGINAAMQQGLGYSSYGGGGGGLVLVGLVAVAAIMLARAS